MLLYLFCYVDLRAFYGSDGEGAGCAWGWPEEKKHWDFGEEVRGEYEREEDDGTKTALWTGGVSLSSYGRRRGTDRPTVTRNIHSHSNIKLCVWEAVVGPFCLLLFPLERIWEWDFSNQPLSRGKQRRKIWALWLTPSVWLHKCKNLVIAMSSSGYCCCFHPMKGDGEPQRLAAQEGKIWDLEVFFL